MIRNIPKYIIITKRYQGVWGFYSQMKDKSNSIQESTNIYLVI